MVNLLISELLKLKRAKMFAISILGAATAPVMIFFALLNMRSKHPDSPILFETAFVNTNMYVVLLLGTLLYGVIAAYLFNREYAENTLKNLLAIPVSRSALLSSKLVLLLLWTAGLQLLIWSVTLLLGLAGGFEGLDAELLVASLRQYLLAGGLLFLLSAPAILITLLFKNYVPTIIFTAAVTMANVMLADSQYQALFPWSAAYVVANGSYFPQYPPYYSFLAIGFMTLAGLVSSFLYFNKSDIR